MTVAEQLDYEAVVIGGGFYGSAIAVYLSKQRGFKKILLLERETALMRRASYNNQARVHNGYHYPRSFTTAYRSRINLPKFLNNWPQVVKKDFTKLYAIARRNSKVTAKQFERFSREIGAKITLADPCLKALFDPRLIEEVFLVEEYAFDAAKLASWAECELSECGVHIRYETKAESILKGSQSPLKVIAESKHGVREQFTCNYVFNCTYSGLNQIRGDFPGVRTGLKHEVTEMALIDLPSPLKLSLIHI